MRIFVIMLLAFCWLVGVSGGALQAQVGVEATTGVGPVTNLPLPRFVSLKASEANARRGPDATHRIDWVYTRRDLPLRVTAEYEHWRRVEDAEGKGGWMHYALLSGVRMGQVQSQMVELRANPVEGAAAVAMLEAGVLVRLRSCQPNWCWVETEGPRGWIEKRHLWGVETDEIFE